MAHSEIQFIREPDALLSGKIDFWATGSDSDCLTVLNLSRDKALIREMEWGIFCIRNDSSCLKEERRAYA